jgi:hypothetical protein
MSPNTLPAQLFAYCCKDLSIKDLSCSPVLILGKGFQWIPLKLENHSIFSMYNNVLNENPVNWAFEFQTT